MRRSSTSQTLVAGLLVLAMVASITGLFGAATTTIKITSPQSGARASGVITVSASVRTSARVAYVILGVDMDRPQSTNSAPYSFELDTTTLTDGAHRLFVEAYDNYGLIASSKVITIRVKNGSAAVQVKAPSPPTRVASAPDTRAASASGAAAEQVSTKAVSPVTSARGPLPEPSHSAAAPAVAPSRPTAPETLGRASFAAGTTTDLVRAPAYPARLRGHTVVLNGRPVGFDVAPIIRSDRMQVGFRAMFEDNGARVSWHSDSRTARSVQGTVIVEVPADSRIAKVNGRQVDLGSAAFIEESRMMIPLRFFAAATGATVHWDSQTQVASVDMAPRALAEKPAR